MNQGAAKTTDSTSTGCRDGRGAGASVGPGPAAGGVGPAGDRGSAAFKGSPSTRCKAAQVRQAPRHPNAPSSPVDSGQPTVLAKPAISVMPVMLLRESRPYRRTSVANAASYSPLPMPMPITIQAAKRPAGPRAEARPASPSAKTTLVAISTGRPPQRSMAAPERGPTSAETTSAMEKAAKTVGIDTPSSRAIGAARIAGR